MKLVGAMHAATVMAARKAATVVHKVVRNAQSKAKQSNATTSLRRNENAQGRKVQFLVES